MKYTIVLLRPEWLVQEGTYGQDIYVANRIEAENVNLAVRMAQEEVLQADIKDGIDIDNSENYKLCVAFEGHLEPSLYSWQLPDKGWPAMPSVV